MGKRAWIDDALERHRERFPPLPPRTAHLTFVVDDRAIELKISMSEYKLEQLRGLFPGKTDSAIVNELADELLARFGIEMRP